MKLYLLRHGESQDDINDDRRPLSTKGKQDIAKIAALIEPSLLAQTQILHSNKLRTLQTANFFKEKVSPNYPFQERVELRPNADIEIILAEINSSTQDMMLVSHMPFLNLLLSQLVIQNQRQSLINFTPGTFVCLEKVFRDQWLIDWVISPELLNAAET